MRHDWSADLSHIECQPAAALTPISWTIGRNIKRWHISTDEHIQYVSLTAVESGSEVERAAYDSYPYVDARPAPLRFSSTSRKQSILPEQQPTELHPEHPEQEPTGQNPSADECAGIAQQLRESNWCRSGPFCT